MDLPRPVPYGPAMPAWFDRPLAAFLDIDEEEPTRLLTTLATERGLAPTRESVSAWRLTTRALTELARYVEQQRPEALKWHCFMEFEVPMRARRIDLAVVADDLVFIIECKTGHQPFTAADRWQTEQYALDLRDFHEPSHGRVLIPMLVTYGAPQTVDPAPQRDRLVQPVTASNEAGFPASVLALWSVLHDATRASIDPDAWASGAYHPTPNIIEAAQSLYGQHDVREIALAGSTNLHSTVDTVLAFIQRCRSEGRRGIAFITGAPGAGKTLAGLEIAHAADIIGNSEGLGLFLSGNWPLVEVIKAAIADSAKASGHRTQRHATREVGTLIDHAYRFRNEYAGKPDRIPHQHVVLFDEAQRAWDASQVARKERDPDARSEPAILLDIMGRTPDWSVIVAMVGSGQEINTGESGLAEWGRALRDSFHDWLVLASSHVFDERTPATARLFTAIPASHPSVATEPDLHLQMNVRSPRAERLNQWVDCLLNGDIEDARSSLPDLREFPMALTRDLETAKQWLRGHCDIEEQQRMGLLASAGGKRLRAWGLETSTLRTEQNWAHWFLRQLGDVRSSNQLEVPATNFDCQGLEIDWAAVCWANDFVPSSSIGGWRIRSFSGTRWSEVRKDPHFVLNGYRVILTRARRGQIIWVPKPDGSDTTLPPADFDAVAHLLQSTGVPLID